MCFARTWVPFRHPRCSRSFLLFCSAMYTHTSGVLHFDVALAAGSITFKPRASGDLSASFEDSLGGWFAGSNELAGVYTYACQDIKHSDFYYIFRYQAFWMQPAAMVLLQTVGSNRTAFQCVLSVLTRCSSLVSHPVWRAPSPISESSRGCAQHPGPAPGVIWQILCILGEFDPRQDALGARLRVPLHAASAGNHFCLRGSCKLCRHPPNPSSILPIPPHPVPPHFAHTPPVPHSSQIVGRLSSQS